MADLRQMSRLLIVQLRFLLCQTGQASAGARDFIARSYPTMKKHNPNTPILIREAFGTPAKVFARFGTSVSMFFQLTCAEFGKETQLDLENRTRKDIEAELKKIIM